MARGGRDMAADIARDIANGSDIALSRGRAARANRVERISQNVLEVEVVLEENGHHVPFDNPWIIVNPPVSTRDGSPQSEDILKEMMEDSRFFRG